MTHPNKETKKDVAESNIAGDIASALPDLHQSTPQATEASMIRLCQFCLLSYGAAL